MLKQYLLWIEAEIKKERFGENPFLLYEPIRYTMRLGGKRIRPLLVLLSYTLYKKNVKKIISLAIAVEVLHSFTLLHDDIMDNAPLRRGQKTVYKKWDINTAILSGDVMFAKVYDLLLKMDVNLFKEAFTLLNRCVIEICEGQRLDIEFENLSSVSELEYLHMIRQKTAALFAFSLEFGALLAQASKQDRKKIHDVGINFGIGFQLQDDLLDVYGDKKKFGKRIGSDILANKKTFMLITALKHARNKDKKELRMWINKKQFDPKQKTAAITAIYDRLNIASLTREKMNFFFHCGLAKLEKLNTSVANKKVLKSFCMNLMDRNL